MYKKFFGCMLAATVVMSSIIGCGKTGDNKSLEGGEVCEQVLDEEGYEEINLAVVVGNHANSVSIPINSISIKNALYNSCYTYGKVSFLNEDGEPKVYYQADIPKPDVNGLSDQKRRKIAEDYRNQLLSILGQAEPVTPEVDTLKAIDQASYVLASGGETDSKVLAIMSSGLSTTGYLDYTKGMLNASVEDVVGALKQADALPDLTDVSVVWMFCGQTASPQKELSEKQKSKLKDMWEAILLESGACSVEFMTDISSEIASGAYPEVSLVDVDERQIDVACTEVYEPVRVEIEQPIETVVLDNASVRFVGDQAVFVDEEAARQVIYSLVQKLQNYPANRVYVIGTTASGSESFCKQLSKDRAQAVCDVLMSYGIPEDQIIPMGLGFEDPWHINDMDETGHQIEEYACQNRKVLIVDVNGEDAKLLK